MGSQLLTLIRGLPGSGKSTVARQLAAAMNACHYEADMFFEQDDGIYRFKYELIGAAHGWCLNSTMEALAGGCSVVVSNTFVRLWEMKPYISLAQEHSIPFQIVEVHGFWSSVHDVPKDVIARMKENWEPTDRSQLQGWEW